MVSKAQIQTSAVRFSTNSRRTAFEADGIASLEAQSYERWNAQVDDARRRVAARIVESLKSKWGTAVALAAATGICQTELSRIRRGKFDRFSLERLVRLLGIVDPNVEVIFEIKIVPKSVR